jgi:hypothetical protein
VSSDIINESVKKEMLLELLKEFISMLLNESPHSPLKYDRVYEAWKRFLFEILDVMTKKSASIFQPKSSVSSVLKSRPGLYTVSSLFRSSRSPFGQGRSVPFLRLSGCWLANYGFCIGKRFEVYPSKGQLILHQFNAIDHLEKGGQNNG